MKEILLTPERKKKGAPIHIIFGQHDDSASSVAGLKHLDRVIGEHLQKTLSGNVVIFQEDANTSASQAKFLQKFIENGQLPSESYVNMIFWGRHLRFPDRGKQEDSREISQIKTIISKFSQEELRIADEHLISSNKRIRVLWEHKPAMEILEDIISRSKADRYKSAINTSSLYVEKGNFKQGLKFFKKAIGSFSKILRKREDRLIQRISAAAENTDVAAVVGHIGNVHTRLGHILTEKGYKVSRTFAQMENGRYLWEPRERAVRHKLISPYDEATELDWYRWMIGSSIQDIFTIIPPTDERTGKPLSQQEIAWKTIVALEKFKNIESITQLEKNIRRNGGLVKAIWGFLLNAPKR